MPVAEAGRAAASEISAGDAHGADGGRIASDARPRALARGGRRRRRGRRRPRDAACARRHHRPSGQRGGRSGDRASADRKRIAGAEGQPAGTYRQRDPPAHAGARNRDPGRVADPVTPHAGGRGAGGIRSARIRPVYALSGARPLAGRRCQRRVDGPAVAAEEPRCRRLRADRAGQACARCATTAVCDPHGAVRQPVRAPVPDPARNGPRAGQAGEPRNPGRPNRARPRGAGKARRTARASAAQCPRPWHRTPRPARQGGQVRDRRNHADRAPGRQRNRDRARR